MPELENEVLANEAQAQPLDPASPAQVAPAPQQPVAQDPAVAPQDPAPTAAPATAPAPSNEVTIRGNRPPAENAMQRTAENLAFYDDLQNGQIHPKTYSDLYEKKSTLGKIGTLFGLLVSGAGSGLAHQSNAVLDMMNKEIERDLEAQKTNQSNKQNWYKVAMEHERSLADIDAINAGSEATRMSTYGAGLESDFKKFKNMSIPGLDEMGASTNAFNNMLGGALQHQQDQINRMAPGPTKTAAQATLDNVVKPAAFKEMAQKQNIFAQKKAVLSALNQTNTKNPNDDVNSDPRGPVVDDKSYQAAIRLGRMDPTNPFAIPPDQVPAVNTTIDRIKLNRNQLADFVDSFQELQKLRAAGQVPMAAVAGSLATGAGAAIGAGAGTLLGAGVGASIGNAVGKSAAELKNVYERERNIQVESLKQRIGKDMSRDERNELIESILPVWNDTDKSRAEAFRKGIQHFHSQEATQNLDQYHILTPFPKIPYQAIDSDEPDKENNVSEKGKKLLREIRNRKAANQVKTPKSL